MSYELQSLRSVRVYVEPAGSYAVDNSGTPGDFIDVPITEGFGPPAPAREMLDPMLAQVYADNRAERVAAGFLQEVVAFISSALWCQQF